MSEAADFELLKKDFAAAYRRRHGKDIREFRQTGQDRYIINGIEFTQLEVDLMLQTLEEELAEKKVSLVKRLIRYFGGKKLGEG